jgi:hypothetical protein
MFWRTVPNKQAGLLRGRGSHILADGHHVYMDAPVGAVVRYKDRSVAVIGFKIGFWSRTLYVYQLQGIKGVKFFAQISFDEWIITETESVARQLLCAKVSIRSAMCNDYFDAEHLSWDEAAKRRRALIRRYNEVPELMGYRLRGKWREKVLGAE